MSDQAPPTPPSAILFDWDNTLVDTWTIIHEALNVTLKAFGQEPWSMEKVESRVARSMRDSFPDLFGDAWEQAAEVFYDHFEKIHLVNLTPLDGVTETLARLSEEGIYMAIVSNKRGAILRREVEHLGWGKWFSEVVGAGDAPRDKPEPDPIHMALATSGLSPGPDIWYAGDTALDMLCAQNAGCLGVMVRQTPPKEGEISDISGVFHTRDCPGLAKMLAKTRAKL